jgi:hypothetical protein
MEETSMTALDKVINAERILNEWLADNTEEVFEEHPEIDTARDMLNEAIELMAEPKQNVDWVPVTEKLLQEQHGWLSQQMWIAMKDGSIFSGVYEWRQGRYPDRFLLDGCGDVWAFEASHVMPLIKPKHPGDQP